MDNRRAAGLLGFEPDLRTARAQPDLDAQHRRRGQLRDGDRRPVDGLGGDLPVWHQQVAAGPPDPAQQDAPPVRHDADAVARRAALEHELVHERRADQHVLSPDRFHPVVACQLPGTQPGAVDHDIRPRSGLAQAGDDALLDPPAQGLDPAGQPAEVERHVGEWQLRREAGDEPGRQLRAGQRRTVTGHLLDPGRQAGAELRRGQQPAREQPHPGRRIARQLAEDGIGVPFPGHAARVTGPEHRARHRPGHRGNGPGRRPGGQHQHLGADPRTPRDPRAPGSLQQRHRAGQPAHPAAHHDDVHAWHATPAQPAASAGSRRDIA